jgi:hypothetical protein
VNDTPRAPIGSEPFSLVRGGPTYRLWRRLGLLHHDRADAWRLPLAMLAVGWIPLLVIGGLEALARGEAPRLLSDISVHVRVAIAVPVFCLAETVVDFFTRRACVRLFASGFLPGREHEVARAAGRAARLRDSVLAEAVLLLLAFVGAEVILGGVGPWEDATQTLAASGGSIARLWYAWVGLPLFLFLASRWLWRWCAWTTLLVGIARLPLEPEPLHPDRAGGLGLLSEVSSSFATVTFGFSCVASATWATRVLEMNVPLATFKPDLAFLVVVACVFAFAPLVIFVPHLSRARLALRSDLARFSLQFSRAFRAHFIRPTAADDLLDTGSIESLASLHDLANHVAQMRVVPISKRSVLVVLLSTLVPVVPLLLTTFSVMELVERLTHSIVGK